MLKIAGVLLVGLVLMVLAVIAWLYFRAVAGGRRAYAALAERVGPVVRALARGDTPSESLLIRYAEDRETRKVLFDALAFAKRIDLFPSKYLSWELMAEADLVAWLCHPNELGAPPSEIELVRKIPAPSPSSPDEMYFVFRYRMHEPHSASKDGWLAGVAGPYATAAGPPCSSASGTFSRFEPMESRSPEEHVVLAHKSVFGEKEHAVQQ